MHVNRVTLAISRLTIAFPVNLRNSVDDAILRTNVPYNYLINPMDVARLR
jgi:hypothetical protein